MGAIDRFLRRGRRQEDYKPMMKRLEAAMLAACRAAGASAWYVPDDFLTLGPELATGVWATAQSYDSTTTGAGSSFSIVGGATYSPRCCINYTTEIGAQYKVTLRLITAPASGSVIAYARDQQNGNGISIAQGATLTAPGYVEFIFTATSTAECLLVAGSVIGTSFSGDSVSVKKILSAKDFQDGTGTLPIYINGIVGMQFDVAGVTGPELIANPDTSVNWVTEGTTPPIAVNGADTYLGKSCRSVAFPAISGSSYPVCHSRDYANEFPITTGTAYSCSFDYALSRDLTAGESIVLPFTGGSSLLSKIVSAGALGNTWYSLSGTSSALANGVVSLRPYPTTLNAPLTVYLRKASAKVAGGNVITQATAGSRPVLTRTPRKLGPELVTNGNFSNGASGWNLSAGISISGGVAQSDATTVFTNGTPLVQQSQNTVFKVGASYLLTYAAAGMGGTDGHSLNAAGVTGQINTGNGIFTQVVAALSAAYPTILMKRASNAILSGNFDNISVREVLEWSYALTYDGTNDSLATSSSVIGATLTQPYTMISWGKVGATTFNRYIQSDTSRALGVSAAMKPALVHNGPGGIYGSTTLQQGQSVVIEGTWDGATSKIYLNGALDASGAHAAPTASPTAHNIGQFGNAGNYYNAEIGGCVVCPAVMTDAQRAAIRKFAAAQMGMTL